MARPDHGLLLGLGDDDHPHYYDTARLAAWHDDAAHGAINHDALLGLDDNDHPQYALVTYVDGLDHDHATPIAAHAALVAAHHTRYTDAEAAAKVAADDLYVKVAGDIITGTLQVNGDLFSNGDWRIRRNGAADGDYYFLDDNFHRWYINSVEVLRVDSAGDLHISGDQMIFDTIAGNDYLQIPEASNYFRVVLDGTEVFRVSTAKNITGTEPYGIDVYRSTTQSIANGSWDPMECNVERYDEGADYSTSTYLWTCPVTGYYTFGADIRIASTAITDLRVRVVHSGGASYEQTQANPIDNPAISCYGARYITAGQTLQAQAYQSSGAARTSYANHNRLWVVKIA